MSDLPIPVSDPFALLLSMGTKAVVVAVVRYALLAVPTFLIGYVLLRRILRARYIQTEPHTIVQLARELTLSISSSIVFAAIDVTVIILSVKGTMKLQVVEPTPPLLTLMIGVAGLLVLHDAYFYWAHRLLHWRPLFRLAHFAHHRSTSPTPFAAFAFHPLEAALHYGFVPLVALFVPLHVMALFFFGIVMTALNVYGHSGIELSPRSFVGTRLGRFLLTPTHHDMHHSSVDYNFGFYTNIWDRLMGTNHPDYEKTFARVVERGLARRSAPASPGDRREKGGDTTMRPPFRSIVVAMVCTGGALVALSGSARGACNVIPKGPILFATVAMPADGIMQYRGAVGRIDKPYVTVWNTRCCSQPEMIEVGPDPPCRTRPFADPDGGGPLTSEQSEVSFVFRGKNGGAALVVASPKRCPEIARESTARDVRERSQYVVQRDPRPMSRRQRLCALAAGGPQNSELNRRRQAAGNQSAFRRHYDR